MKKKKLQNYFVLVNILLIKITNLQKMIFKELKLLKIILKIFRNVQILKEFLKLI